MTEATRGSGRLVPHQKSGPGGAGNTIRSLTNSRITDKE